MADGWDLREPDASQLIELGRHIREWWDHSEWDRWDTETRRSCPSAAHDQIRQAYGLPPQPLLFKPLPRRHRGAFQPSTGSVVLNEDSILEREPLKVLSTLAHENRHALQFRRLSANPAYLYAAGDQARRTEVEIWREAWAAYSTKDYDRYVYNALEVDARETGYQVVVGFQQRDGELLRQELSGQRSVRRFPLRAPSLRRSSGRRMGPEAGR